MASTAAPPHRPCTDLEEPLLHLEDDAVHRFILGLDGSPRRLSHQEASDKLGDSFATELLLRGVFRVQAATF